MPYLVLSIIAAIILVAIAIRRLPYLRTHRLGLEIMSNPRPYSPRTNAWTHLTQRALGFWHGLSLRRSSVHFDTTETASPVVTQSYTPSPVASADNDFGATALPPQLTTTSAHSGDFWQEESPQTAGPLEIPTQGLITRRGEAQKIAHELVSQADDAFRKKDFKKAEKFYLQAATKDPDNARIYNRLGVIYLQTKNYKDAVEAFRGALKFDDRVASRHYNLALAYLGKRDYRSAKKALQEAIRQEPTNEKYRKTLEALERQPV